MCLGYQAEELVPTCMLHVYGFAAIAISMNNLTSVINMCRCCVKVFPHRAIWLAIAICINVTCFIPQFLNSL